MMKGVQSFMQKADRGVADRAAAKAKGAAQSAWKAKKAAEMGGVVGKNANALQKNLMMRRSAGNALSSSDRAALKSQLGALKGMMGKAAPRKILGKMKY